VRVARRRRRRKLTTVDGAEIFETLTEAGERTYSYTIDESPLPVADYRATIAARPDGDAACTVTWVAHFTASGASDGEAEAVIQGIFDAGPRRAVASRPPRPVGRGRARWDP
jgi:hypothetical protein